jgi:dihydropyrimidinase
MGVLIKNGTIVTALDRWVGDVLCRDGRIVALGSSLEGAAEDELVDASGQYVFPGGVDPHVHLSLPVMGTVSADDFESGTIAALAGGTTTILDFVHPERGQDYFEALRARRAEAARAVIDYGFHMGVTWWGDGVADMLGRCVRDEGIPSFKVYMAYKDTVGLDDRDLIRVMRAVGELDGLLMVHAEHGDMVEELRNRFAAEGKTAPRYHALSRPPALEGEAVGRAAILAAFTGVNLYVVHVTCRESLRNVTEAREGGARIHGETCPHYLLLDDSVYDQPWDAAARYVLSPPIRAKGHQEALWQGLKAGILEVVSTDHCPFNTAGQKDAGRDDFRKIPNGAAGIEHRMALLYTYGVSAGKIDPFQFVDLTSTRAARLFGLYPRKGSVTVGADADLVVWDPEATGVISAKTHHHRCDASIYEGFPVRGLPSTVLSDGRIQFHRGDLRVEPGSGRFLARSL